MKNRFFLIITSVLTFLSMTVSAKSPTSKVTITGPGLTQAVEVTDATLLSKFNVWGGGFINRSQGIVSEPPGAMALSYEVSFYIQLSNDRLKKVYVFSYYPDTFTQGGYIYLPGEGDPRYRLNTSSILRDGYDGRWLLATESWNAFIRPLNEATTSAGSARR